PNVNASYNEETKEITYYDAEHLGFAVDTDQGLLSPVIHNAGDLSLAGLARAIADIAARARTGDLKPDELSGGTFTITTSAARARCSIRRSWSRRRRRCWVRVRLSSGRG
ncbi:MAG: sucB, partial [Mycobacterium sp.]|nr:sucB [Mycobacterium sp.]